MADSDVRRQILDAATHLFASQGYKSTSVREVVEAAGVTKPTLYYWFDNKEALFREVVEAHLEGMRDLLGSEISQPGSVRERFARFTRTWIETALAQREAIHLLMIAQNPVDSEQPTVDLMGWHTFAINELGKVLQRGIDSGELRHDLDLPIAAASWLGMVNHILMGFLHGVPYDPTVSDRLVDLYFAGVAAR